MSLDPALGPIAAAASSLSEQSQTFDRFSRSQGGAYAPENRSTTVRIFGCRGPGAAGRPGSDWPSRPSHSFK